MNDVRKELRSYYEEEARLRLRRVPGGWRAEVRREFCELLEREGRRSVIDFGAGPGSDGLALADAGFCFVGLDLAHGNGLLAAEAGIDVIQASMSAPPIRPDSFDAGLSMSTLMHIPENEVAAAVEAMATALVLGAPLLIGLWGGERRDEIDDAKLDGQRRLFSLRPLEVNRRLIATCGHIEREQQKHFGADRWDYQLFLVRVGGRPAG